MEHFLVQIRTIYWFFSGKFGQGKGKTNTFSLSRRFFFVLVFNFFYFAVHVRWIEPKQKQKKRKFTTKISSSEFLLFRRSITIPRVSTGKIIWRFIVLVQKNSCCTKISHEWPNVEYEINGKSTTFLEKKNSFLFVWFDFLAWKSSNTFCVFHSLVSWWKRFSSEKSECIGSFY